MKPQIRLVFTCCALFVLPAIAVTKPYRKDYEYNEKSDSFYKLHINEEIADKAESFCTLEGGKLMVYSGTEDATQVVRMLKEFPDLGDYVWIAADGQTHETAKEPIVIDLSPNEVQVDYGDECSRSCQVLSRSGAMAMSACCNKHPFVCKVDAKDVSYDPQCDVFGFQYEYYSSVGSCYKVSRQYLTWNEAFAECGAEDAHLVILNSEEEHRAVWDLIQAVPRMQSYYFAGLRADDSKRFLTVLGQSPHAEGYNEWTLGSDVNGDLCGAINSEDGKYIAVPCRGRRPFVCEKEVRPISILGN